MAFQKGQVSLMKGRNHTDGAKRKMSEAHKKLTGEKASFWGKHHSEESKEKNRQAHLGKEWSSDQRKKMELIREQRGHGFHWNGGRCQNDAGYILRCSPTHPFADKRGYVREHRLVAEKALGRYMKSSEAIHHVNGIKDDNRNQNLLICTDSYHKQLHLRMSRLYMKEKFGGK